MVKEGLSEVTLSRDRDNAKSSEWGGFDGAERAEARKVGTVVTVVSRVLLWNRIHVSEE